MMKTKLDLIVENIKKAFDKFSLITLVSVSPKDIDYKWNIATFEIVISLGANAKYLNHYYFKVDLDYIGIRTIKQSLVYDNEIIKLDYVDLFDIDYIISNVRKAIDESKQQIKEFENGLQGGENDRY